MLNKRVISAVIALVMLFFLVKSNLYIFCTALSIVAFVGLYEYFNAVGSSSIKPMKILGIISGLMILALTYSQNSFAFFVPLLTLILLILMSVPVINTKYNFWGAGATFLGILYVSLLFVYIYLIRAIPEKGVYLLWFVFICSCCSDTCAYFSGLMFGKTKLCPSVSPKKTVEGSIGGIIGSTLGCLVYEAVLSKLNIISIPILHILVIGILGSVVSQFGDLAASSIKRNVNIKDFGKIIPGHGGILDRVDSILFVAPLIYYYITWILL